MTNSKVQIKLKQRCNKLDSKDYDNLECWMMQEAMNKAQIEFCRINAHGGNPYREGAEQSTTRVDDLQNLITSYSLKGDNGSVYFESNNMPKDYFRFNKVILKGIKGSCTATDIKVYEAEEANSEVLLGDINYSPSFEWRETFCTLASNKVRIYTNNDFKVKEATLVYYRMPKEIQFKGCVNLDDGTVYTNDQICEFKDDIVEVMIDMAASILTGDVESMQTQRLAANADKAN